MKYYLSLALVFLLISTYASAQDSTNVRVEQNRNKINELSKRINTLMDTSGTSTSATTNIDEHNQLKNSNLLLKDSIRILQAKIEGLNNNLMQQSEYYIVVSSVRTFTGIDAEKNRLKESFDSLSIVRNQTRTWYHLILPKQYSKSNAVDEVNKLRKGSVKDAWFLSGKELSREKEGLSENTL